MISSLKQKKKNSPRDWTPGRPESKVFPVLHKAQSHTSLLYPVTQKRECRGHPQGRVICHTERCFSSGFNSELFAFRKPGFKSPITKHVLLWVCFPTYECPRGYVVGPPSLPQ